MSVISYKYRAAFVLIMLFISPQLSHAYKVSGLVEFSYRDYETKIGGNRTSSAVFVQTYRADIATPIYDPRVLVLSGGVGYDIYKNIGTAYPDNDLLSYRLGLDFFPSSMIGWNLYGTKNKNNYQSSSSLVGYDVITTGYGATFRANLSRLGTNGKNRNNNNNNNNDFGNDTGSGRSSRFPKPEIFLMHDHIETESLNAPSPLSESRDTSRGDVRFNGLKYFVNISGTQEEYVNGYTIASYDQSTFALTSNFKVAPHGDLIVNGNSYDRTTHNIIGYESGSRGDAYSAQLSFSEVNRYSHYYRYDYSYQDDHFRAFTGHQFNAQGSYRMTPEVKLMAGLNYRQADYFMSANGSVAEENNKNNSVGLVAGVSYAQLYRPEFLGPFGLNTAYDFSSGFSTVSSDAPGAPTGSGLYYGNRLNFAFTSMEWKNENLLLEYGYDSRRDHSPVGNQFVYQTIRLNALTSRLPRTTAQANASYYTRQSSNTIADAYSIMRGDQIMQNRSMTFSADVKHALTREITLNAGATKSDTQASATYSLVSLTSRNFMENETIYLAAFYNANITRRLDVSGELREERFIAGGQTSDISTFRMNFNYRIRMLSFRLEYRWQQLTPEQGLKSVQQYTFASLSRPF